MKTGMLWRETDKNITGLFENGSLPTMVYIYKQFRDSERQTLKRPLHRHESICEFLLITRGESFYVQENKTYKLTEGDIICCNQGMLHEMSTAGGDDVDCYCIGIANVRKKGLPENYLIKESESCVRPAGKLYGSMRNICEEIFQLEGSGVGGNLAAQLLCAALISMIDEVEDETKAEERGSEEIMFRRMQDYLNQHFTEEITLDSVAKALGCSQTYVSHLYKKTTGKTPMQYVISRRIGLAQTLLISTELTATEIATRVGYDNTNYFTTLFSKIVGMTPIRYRTNYKENFKGTGSQL